MNNSSLVKTMLVRGLLTILFILGVSYLLMYNVLSFPGWNALYGVCIMAAGFIVLGVVQFFGVQAHIVTAIDRLVNYTKSATSNKKTIPLEGPFRGELDTLAQALVTLVETAHEREQEAITNEHAAQDRLREIEATLKELQEHDADSRQLLESMQQAADQAKQVSSQVTDSVGDLSNEVEKVHSGMQTQTDRMIETATAMEQMHMTVMEIAQNAASAASNAKKSQEKAQIGALNVKESVQSILAIEKRVLGLKETMDRLGAQAESIGEVLRVINDIADQTNLLALNAAIEAARAGDAGRGFAVVADEVRKLAEKTMTATQEVEGAIASIQDVARMNIDAVDATAENITTSTASATKAGEFMQEIVALIEETSAQVESIATASEEQSATSDQITGAVAEVSNVAEQTAIGMGRSAETLARMTGLVGELDGVVHNICAANKPGKTLGLSSGKLMEWSDELSVGIDSIDRQHKRLLDLINQLNDAMKNKRSKTTLLQTIDALKQYTVEHFSKEEELFKRYGYPDEEAHRRVHASFVDKVKTFEKDVKAGRVTVSLSIMNFLKDWLIKHIMGTDKKYGPFLSSKGVR